MEIVLGIVVGAVALLYLGAPLLVRRRFWISLDPGPRFVRDGQLDDDVAAELDERGRDLEAAGLERIADVIVREGMPDTTTISRYLADGSRTTVGVATVIVAQRGDRREVHAFSAVGARQLHADGTWTDVTTTDSDEPDALRVLDDVVVRIPDAPAAALVASQRRSVDEHITDAVRGRVKSPVDVARQDVERMVAAAVDAGLLVGDGGGRYRLTLRGAYRAAWANMPPMLGRARKRFARQGQERLRQIGWQDDEA